MDWGISQEGCFDRVIIVQGASRLPGQEARLCRGECTPHFPCSRRGGIPMSGQGEGAFGAKITGVPGGTVPVRYGEAKGIFSFEKRMSPRPPKEKRGGISISPRTPLKRHKGAGCGPPLWKPLPELDRVVRSEAERTGVEIRQFGFAAPARNGLSGAGTH